MCGAFMSPALKFVKGQPVEYRTVCPFCSASVAPSLEHVLWSCSDFSDLRRLPRPSHALAARLGWSDSGHPCLDTLRQMGAIGARVARDC